MEKKYQHNKVKYKEGIEQNKYLTKGKRNRNK